MQGKVRYATVRYSAEQLIRSRRKTSATALRTPFVGSRTRQPTLGLAPAKASTNPRAGQDPIRHTRSAACCALLTGPFTAP